MDEFIISLKTCVRRRKFIDIGMFRQLVKYLCETVSKELMENTLKYFMIYPQQIRFVPIRKKFHPLALFLASRHGQISYSLNFDHFPIEKLAYLMSAFYKQYPLMMCDPKFVLKIQKKFDAYKMLIDSPNWFNENKDLFIGLHGIGFDENECEELFTKLKCDMTLLKVTPAALSFVELVASKCNRDIEYIQYLIELTISLHPKNKNITLLTNNISRNLKQLDDTDNVIHISDWDTFIMKAIKHGLKKNNPNYDFITILKLLIKKCHVDAPILKSIFTQITNHSQFSNIMLNYVSNQVQKEELLRLIEKIVKAEPSVIIREHVAFYLCSYNASLSASDQIILRILYYYDQGFLIMSDFKPYLWGSLAISLYQSPSTSNNSNSFPSITEVISNVSLKRILPTIKMFPSYRILDAHKQYITRYDKNTDPSLMYDPAFFLPMIKLLIMKSPLISINQFNKNGCLSMVLICLSSEDLAMRTLAHSILKLLRFHLTSFYPESLFWDYFMKFVLSGLKKLTIASNKSELPKLCIFEGLFLSRMALSLVYNEQSVKPIFCALLTNNSVAQLGQLKDLKTFINHIAVQEAAHLNWFLVLLRDGLRTKRDLDVLIESDFLNIIMFIFKRSSINERLVILQLMKAAFAIESRTCVDISYWDLGFMLTLDKFSLRSCISTMSPEEVIEVFQCLQFMSEKSYVNHGAVDLWLNLFKKHGMSRNICLEGLATLKSFALKYRNVHRLIEEKELNCVLNFGFYSGVLKPPEMKLCRSALKHGPHGFKIEETDEYVLLPTIVNLMTKTMY